MTYLSALVPGLNTQAWEPSSSHNPSTTTELPTSQNTGAPAGPLHAHRPASPTATRMAHLIARSSNDPTAPLLPSESMLARHSPTYEAELREEMHSYSKEELQQFVDGKAATNEVRIAAQRELDARDGIEYGPSARKFNIEGQRFESLNALALNVIKQLESGEHDYERWMDWRDKIDILNQDQSGETAKAILQQAGYQRYSERTE